MSLNYRTFPNRPLDAAAAFLPYTLSHHPTHQLAARQPAPLNGVYFYICVFGARDAKSKKDPCRRLLSSDCARPTKPSPSK